MDRYAYAIEFDHYNPATSLLERAYVADIGHVRSATDTPANRHFAPLLLQPGLIRRDVFADRTSAGMSRVGAGETLLTNINGQLDWLMDHGVDGRAMTIRYGKLGTAYPAAWTTVLAGTLQQALPDLQTLTLRIRDRQALLAELPISASVYAGDNSAGNGVEGEPGDLKAKRKPRLFGSARNFSPPCVNTSKLVYQVNDGAVATVAAYDKRAALTRGADYASQADLLTNNPAANTYRVWPAGGLIRLGTKPTQLTCDASEGATVADRCPAKVMQRILTGPGGVASGEIVASDVSALASAAPGECGIWCAGDEPIGAVMSRVANSAGAWWGIDALGQWRMRQLVAPTGSAAMTITKRQIELLELMPGADDGAGLPPYRTEVSYALNATVMREVAGAVSAADAAWVAQQWRTAASADNAAILAQHPLAPIRRTESLYLSASDATAEANRQQALHGTRRDWLRVNVRLRPADLALLDLGTEVQLVYPRLGYTAGRNLIVMGMLLDLARNRAELTLWG